MNSQNLPWITTISFISVLKLLVAFEFPQYLGNPDEMLYQSCGGSFSCGSVTGVDYPFRGNEKPDFCGYPGLALDCQNDTTTIDINNLTFRVLGIDQARQTMKIAREDVMDSGCPQKLVNTSMDNSLFDYDSNYMNLTFLYGCPGSTIPNVSPVSCKAPEGYGSVFLLPGTVGPQSCDVSVTVPVSVFSGPINSTGIGPAIQRGFEVKWKVDSKACSECTASKGRCGYGIVANRTTCYCPSEPYVADTCGGSAGAATPASSGAPGLLFLSLFS